MTTGSLLSKAGYKVLILEQHDVAGGATHTFTEKGFTFDVGIHYIGERMTSTLSPCRKLFDVISDGCVNARVYVSVRVRVRVSQQTKSP